MRERSLTGRPGLSSVGGTLLALVAAAGLFQFGQQAGTPHSEGRLLSDAASVQPGQPFTIGLQIRLDQNWHTYWTNAGDAGTGVLSTWELPPGFAIDSLHYPEPTRIPYPPLMSYGYKDEVVLLATVTPPADLAPGQRVRLKLDAEWLVCDDVCIPARDSFTLELPVRTEAPRASADAALVERWRARIPAEDHDWTLRAARTDGGFVLAARPPAGWGGSLAGAYFFPVDPTTLTHTEYQDGGEREGELRLSLAESPFMMGEPEALEGILTLPPGSAFDDAGSTAILVRVPVEREQVAWAGEAVTPLARPEAVVAGGAAAGGAGGLTLLVALLFAFIGGLILNLMPCVFPILSLKALGFASRGGDRRAMRLDGLAFGAGVIVTFLVVAGVLLGIRAGGAEVGWGYQLQSPAFVAALAALMFGIGLWLAGVVELGASLTRLGGVDTGSGPGSGFFTGVLATVVATPCTAPFMGAAMGAALIRPAGEALAIFGGLGAGMAAPYVMLAFWPALARRLPKPGRWMETFKQALAFPMFAVAIWLVWVFGLQVGMGGAARLLFGMLLLGMAAWLVGRWPAPAVSGRTRLATRVLATAALVVAVVAGAGAARDGAVVMAGGDVGSSPLQWEPFSEQAVAEHREAGRPVFVDFTAAWCISCQVNERMALETAAVRRAFAERDVALLKADWTRRDPEITRALASFGRVGVPLYVLYPADPSAEPAVLPELLTQRIVLDALESNTNRRLAQ